MNAVLVKLLLLRLRGGLRHRLLELRTLRGLLFISVTITVITLLMMQPALPENPLGSLLTRKPEQLRAHFAQFMPIGLLSAFLMTAFISPSPGLYFNPSEIDLLFSGPFKRRALILYKLSNYAFGVLLSSLLITLLATRNVNMPLATLLGTFLALTFIQLLTVATGLLSQLSGRFLGVHGRKRYFVIILLIPLAMATIWYYTDHTDGLVGALTQFQSSTGGALVLAPFNVFVHVFMAQSLFPDLLAWAMLGLAMNAGLVAAIIWLDLHCSEASISASLKIHKRWDRARRGGGLPWSSQPMIVRSSIHAPILGGTGPIAWRQMLSACRCSSKALLSFLFLAILAAPLQMMVGADISKLSLISGVIVTGVFILPKTFVFDFRSDLGVIENLKSLPLSSWKICIGQLAAPVLLTSLIELVLLCSSAIVTESHLRYFLIAISLFLVPFNLLLYGIENLFFLLFPAPLVPIGRADFDFIGRTLVGYTVTATVLIMSCLMALGAGYVTAKATALSWPAFVFAAWLSLTFIALMMLPLMSWAFKRFDVSRC